MKKTTKLKKLMDAYCARVGKEAGSIRFLFDGDRIAPDSTPNDLNMEDEDEIDAMVEVCYFMISIHSLNLIPESIECDIAMGIGLNPFCALSHECSLSEPSS